VVTEPTPRRAVSRRVDYESEVFDPSAVAARQIVSSGDVKAID
jgi:hypothetical protein